MCGIFSYVGESRNPSEVVIQGLQSVAYKGYDSWGIGVPSQATIHAYKAVGRLPSNPTLPLPRSTVAFGHTRWATVGHVAEPNAHPQVDCNSRIAVVHNGSLQQYAALQTKLHSGHHLRSTTDSEVISHLLEEHCAFGDLQEAVRQTFPELQGSTTCLVCDALTDTLIAVRNGPPLFIGIGDSETFISSDLPSLLPFTKRVLALANGQYGVIHLGDVLLYDFSAVSARPYESHLLDEQEVASLRPPMEANSPHSSTTAKKRVQPGTTNTR